jgi:hypothetical protein
MPFGKYRLGVQEEERFMEVAEGAAIDVGEGWRRRKMRTFSKLSTL